MSTTVQQEHKTCQSTGKHSLNRTVFSSWRKATKVGAFLTRVGREFQALAAAAGKAWSPSVEHHVDGTSSVNVLADRRWRVARWKLGGWSQLSSSVLIREDSETSTHITGTECALAVVGGEQNKIEWIYNGLQKRQSIPSWACFGLWSEFVSKFTIPVSSSCNFQHPG